MNSSPIAPHPGSVVANIMSQMNLSPQYVARHIGFPEIPLIRFLEGKERITADLAERLSRAGFGPTQALMNMQVRHDLATVPHHVIPDIEPIVGLDVEICE